MTRTEAIEEVIRVFQDTVGWGASKAEHDEAEQDWKEVLAALGVRDEEIPSGIQPLSVWNRRFKASRENLAVRSFPEFTDGITYRADR